MTAPRLSAGGMIGGKYTVRSMLGNGGAVITYHAVSQQGQEVAIKLYDPAVASHATVMKSLEQAYAATNALPQNSAAPIIDAGYDQPTLAPFSVTELIRLPSLQSQQRRLPPEEVVALLNGLARSLDLAHVRNVVHGAIKPTNVFTGPLCNPIIVTDFAANLPKAAIPTQEGFVLSAPWIAPEQAQSGSVTPAADVFSVGLLVFYALTGRTYWRATQGTAFDLAGWQQELATPRSPASQRAAELGVPLSPSLDMVLWKALSNDPQERYKSVGEFANVLEDSMRSQLGHGGQQGGGLGSAATMALPMVGDAPSPLPPGMRNPEAPRPAAGMPANLQNASTMALPPEAFLPPTGAGPAPNGMAPPLPTQAMSLEQLQAQQLSMQGRGGEMTQGYPPGYGYPPHGQQGGFGQGEVAQAQIGTPAPMVGPAAKKPGNKVVPIAIAFIGVALLGVVLTVVFLRLTSEKPASSDPVKSDTSSKTSASASSRATAPPPPPPGDTTAHPTATTAAASSAPAIKQVELKLACKPSPCDEIKIDGKAVDASKPVMVDPGSHDVSVSKSGFVSQDEKLDVKEGSAPQSKTFTLVADKPVSTPTGPPRPPPPPPPPNRKPPCRPDGFIKRC